MEEMCRRRGPPDATTVVPAASETTDPADGLATTTSAEPATTSIEPTTTVVLSEQATAAQAIVDRLVIAWNDGDEQAVPELFSPDFSYNDAIGVDRVDGATDRFVGYVNDFELVRAREAAENETGTFTWVIEFWSDASTRYPAEVLDLDITFSDGMISHIDEHQHRDS